MRALIWVLAGSLPLTMLPADDGARAEEADPAGKIRFNITRLDDHGLYGPPDGLRALHYEFCVPATVASLAEVTTIDPTARIYRRSPGRIGCRGSVVLVVGSTHQPGFRAVLARLSSLSYVDRIEETVFE
jgi:hypothetical protein